MDIRSIVYQEVLVAYLAYVKRRGFAMCFLWACPPYKGDDYIFHIHPSEQKTPKPERLVGWYHNIVNTCMDDGTALSRGNLWDHYFLKKDRMVTDAPYFDGDYWPGQAEDAIDKIERQAVASGLVRDGETPTKRAKKRRKTKASEAEDDENPEPVPEVLIHSMDAYTGGHAADSLKGELNKESFRKEDFLVIHMRVRGRDEASALCGWCAHILCHSGVCL